MARRQGTLHRLMVSLIYPAVLGSVLFGTLQTLADSVDRGSRSGFLLGTPRQVGMKVLLFLLILVFFCCDYLYTMASGKYGVLYFLVDLVVLGALTLAFVSLHLSSMAVPAARMICVLFAAVLLLYLLWDSLELRKSRARSRLRSMCTWELVSAVAILIVAAVDRSKALSSYQQPLMLLVLAISTGCFLFLVRWRLREGEESSV